MNYTSKTVLRMAPVLGLVGLALSATGCAQPKVITAVTSANDQIKFLYVEGSKQGVMKCKVGTDGALSQCRKMAVVFKD